MSSLQKASNNRKYNFVSNVIFITILLFTVCTTLFLYFTDGMRSKVDVAKDSLTEFSTQWVLADGSSVDDVSKLNLVDGASSTQESSIYAVLPQSIGKGEALSFRAKHLYFSVYIDGECVYEQDLPENDLYTNSVGATWAFIPVGSEDAGKTLELRYKLAYDGSSCGIDHLEYGSERGELLTYLDEKMFGVVMSIIFLTVALVLIVMDIPVTRRIDKRHEFFFLGMITLSATVYCLSETQVFQMFIGNERIVHLITCYSLLVIPIPVVLYTNAVFNILKPRFALGYTVAHAVMFVTLTLLNYLDIADYHDTMTIIHAMVFISIAVMFSTIVRHIIKSIKFKGHVDMYVAFEILGLSFMMITGVIDVCRFYIASATDPAKYMRIGLLAFVICYAVSSCEKLVDALRLSAKAELVAKLAYQDGLTGLYNRTAFNERLAEILGNGRKVGMCTLDINNLKIVNDTYGHSSGDDLIRECGRIISKAFEDCDSSCYRIGGDEFVALVFADNDADFDELLKVHEQKISELCDEVNGLCIYKFGVRLACGSSVYNGRGDIEVTLKTADRLMYEHKKKLKDAPKDSVLT